MSGRGRGEVEEKKKSSRGPLAVSPFLSPLLRSLHLEKERIRELRDAGREGKETRQRCCERAARAQFFPFYFWPLARRSQLASEGVRDAAARSRGSESRSLSSFACFPIALSLPTVLSPSFFYSLTLTTGLLEEGARGRGCWWI